MSVEELPTGGPWLRHCAYPHALGALNVPQLVWVVLVPGAQNDPHVGKSRNDYFLLTLVKNTTNRTPRRVGQEEVQENHRTVQAELNRCNFENFEPVEWL